MLPPRPTLRTIAALAGCSAQTVSLALRNDGRISGPLREKIQRLAREIGYAPDGEMATLMARIRGRGPARHQAGIGVLHMLSQRAAEASAPYAEWRAGAAAAAGTLGYVLDDFWVGEERLGVAEMERMIAARNIPGVLVLCAPGTPPLPALFHPLLATQAAVIAGFPCPRTPRLPLATNDRFATGAMLYRRAQAAGYRRIGAVFHDALEPRADARFTAGIESARRFHGEGEPVPELRCPADCHRKFDAWLARERPDCVIATVPEVWDWLALLGRPAPESIGFLSWQVPAANEQWSGTRQNDATIGAAALELLVNQLHRGEHGTPRVRSRVLVESSPAAGRTVLSGIAVG